MDFKGFFQTRLLMEANPEKRIDFLWNKYKTSLIQFFTNEFAFKTNISESAYQFVENVVTTIDPLRGVYSEWIIRNFLKLSKQDASMFNEDAYKITQDLENYTKYKRFIPQLTRERVINTGLQHDRSVKIDLSQLAKDSVNPKKLGDINQIVSFAHLIQVLEYLQIFINQDKKKNLIAVNTKNAEKIYDSANWLIVVPKTVEASCAYGSGTRWCTAADSSYNAFEQYNREGPLYIIINKETQNRWQFHFQTSQFMDAGDNHISVSKFARENPELRPILVQIAEKNNATDMSAEIDPDKFVETLVEYQKRTNAKDDTMYGNIMRADMSLLLKVGVKMPEYAYNIQHTLFFAPDGDIHFIANDWASLANLVGESRRGNESRRAYVILNGDIDENGYFESISYDPEYWDWVSPRNMEKLAELIEDQTGKRVEKNEIQEFIDEINDKEIKSLLTGSYSETMQHVYYTDMVEHAQAAIKDVLGYKTEYINKYLHFTNHTEKDIMDMIDIIEERLGEKANTAHFYNQLSAALQQEKELTVPDFDGVDPSPDKRKKDHYDAFNEWFENHLGDVTLKYDEKLEEQNSFTKFFLVREQNRPKFRTFYHVTPSENTQNILKQGLIPQKGDRAKLLGEGEDGIYLFRDIVSATDAIGNWLGDEFDEAQELDLLKIMLPIDFPLEDNPDMYEVISRIAIPAESVYLLKKNI